jgi:caffeoyl-CoA O-methyltransferase
MLAAGEAGRFDFAFIDADKENYPHYYEAALELLRPGGLVAVDNVLWSGRVAEPRNTEASTEIMRELNRKVRADERVDMSLLPLGDGLLLARKR